jgi:hypothetical protein
MQFPSRSKKWCTMRVAMVVDDEPMIRGRDSLTEVEKPL